MNNNKLNRNYTNLFCSFTLMMVNTDSSDTSEDDQVKSTLSATPSEVDIDAIFLKMKSIEDELIKYKGKFQQLLVNNRHMKKEIKYLTFHKDEVLESLYSIETELTAMNQYSRRQNIEIVNIPETVSQINLENTVMDILKCIGVEVNSYDIIAVHRLGKKFPSKPRNVICRFINRKHVFDSFKNKKLLSKTKVLGFNNLYFIENLCPVNRYIWNKCNELRSEGLVKSVWSFNGVINIKFTDDYNEKPTLIHHTEDIEYYIHNDSLDF